MSATAHRRSRQLRRRLHYSLRDPPTRIGLLRQSTLFPSFEAHPLIVLIPRSGRKRLVSTIRSRSKLSQPLVGVVLTKDQWAKVLRLYKPNAIAAQATQLRSGHACQFETPANEGPIYEADYMCRYNVHFPLIFDDGVRWLVRTRQRLVRSHDIPTISEVETMNVMKRHGLKVPSAFMPIKDHVLDAINQRLVTVSIFPDHKIT